jgi:hypothetical protein
MFSEHITGIECKKFEKNKSKTHIFKYNVFYYKTYRNQIN